MALLRILMSISLPPRTVFIRQFHRIRAQSGNRGRFNFVKHAQKKVAIWTFFCDGALHFSYPRGLQKMLCWDTPPKQVAN